MKNQNFIKFNKTILVVDDDAVALSNIVEFFEDYFLRVHSALSASEAKKFLFEENIDVVVTDLQMSGIHGIDFIKSIRKDSIYKDVIIFVISAYAHQEYLMDLIPMGVSQFVSKPLTYAKMAEVIETCEQKFQKDDVFFDAKHECSYSYRTKKAYCRREDVHLTFLEATILEILIERPGELVRYELLENILHKEGTSANSLKVAISRIRKKLYAIDIRNVSGAGYMLCLP